MKFVKIEGGVKLSQFIAPMSATLSDESAFDDPKWLFEIKWDGYRAIAELKGKESRLYSRNGLSFVKAYPKVFKELVKLKQRAIIDGEVVVFRDGLPSFQAIQNGEKRKGIHWGKPKYSCQVQYVEITDDGHVRHPSFLGLRKDK